MDHSFKYINTIFLYRITIFLYIIIMSKINLLKYLLDTYSDDEVLPILYNNEQEKITVSLNKELYITTNEMNNKYNTTQKLEINTTNNTTNNIKEVNTKNNIKEVNTTNNIKEVNTTNNIKEVNNDITESSENSMSETYTDEDFIEDDFEYISEEDTDTETS
jgi:hypothetical protein